MMEPQQRNRPTEGKPVSFHIRPGVLDTIAQKIGATSDKELATFLGIKPHHLEAIRYGKPLNLLTAAQLQARIEAHCQAADLLKSTAA